MTMRAVLLLVPLATSLVLWILGPGYTTPGDPLAIKTEARHLLSTGELGIPPESPELPRGLLPPSAKPGQYFFENSARHRLFSRWGAWATIAFAVPLALSTENDALSTLRALNVWNALWGGLLVMGLLLMCLGAGVSTGVALIVTFSVVLGSNALFYLRAHTTEPIQLAASAWMMAAWVQMRMKNRRVTTGWMLVALFGASVLFMLKLYFFPVLAVLWLLIARSSTENRHVMLGAACVLIVGMLRGLVNLHEFQDFFAPGVGAENPSEPGDYLALSHVFPSWAAFLWGARGSVIMHAPIVALAIPGLVLLWRRDRLTFTCATMTMGLLLVVTAPLRNPLGEWGHGPRYMLPGIPPLALAAALVVEDPRALQVSERIRRMMKPLAGLVLAVGMWLEWPAVQFQPFAFYQLEGALLTLQPGNETVADYFAHTPQSWVLRELARHCAHDEDSIITGLIAETFEASVNPDKLKILGGIGGLCTPNVLLPWADPPSTFRR